MATYKKIAGVVFTFRRPHYTRRTLKSLANNTEAGDIDWFVFQDGIEHLKSGVKYADEEPHSKVTKIIMDSDLPNLEFNLLSHNHGIAQLRYMGLQLLKSYNLVYCFDDDMVVSKYYLRLLRIMAEQYPNFIGILHNHKNPSSNHRVLRRCTIARLWGHYMNRSVYNKFEEEHTRYYNAVKKIDYNQRSERGSLRDDDIPYVMDDIVITRFCRLAGVAKLWPDVSRGLYIGEQGDIAYKTPEYWKKKGMHKQAQRFEFESDATLEGFKLR